MREINTHSTTRLIGKKMAADTSLCHRHDRQNGLHTSLPGVIAPASGFVCPGNATTALGTIPSGASSPVFGCFRHEKHNFQNFIPKTTRKNRDTLLGNPEKRMAAADSALGFTAPILVLSGTFDPEPVERKAA